MMFSVNGAQLVVVDTPSAEALLRKIEDDLLSGRSFAVATLNLDHLYKLKHSTEFQKVYAQQTHVVADGNPVVWLSRIAGRPVRLAPGSELIHPLGELAARLDVPIALLGSTEAALERAATVLEATHSGLRVVARIAPPFGFDVTGEAGDACLEAVRQSGARMCFLALGAPKQETLAARGLDRVPGCGFLSVGAGIDFIAGTQRRAPAWVRSLAMEWLWRMACDPYRLAGRYARAFTILPGLLWQALGVRFAAHAPDSGALRPRSLEAFSPSPGIEKVRAASER